MSVGSEEITLDIQPLDSGIVPVKGTELVSVPESPDGIAKQIDASREKVLQKEFGPKFPQERITAVINQVRSLLDAVPEKPALLTSASEREVCLIVPVVAVSGPAELVTVNLRRRQKQGETKEEIRIAKWFEAPIMEFGSDGEAFPSKTRKTVKDDDLGFMMIGEAMNGDLVIWKNLFQENMLENERVNVNFFVQCGLDNLLPGQMKGLNNEQRRRMGIFYSDENSSLAEREIREGSMDDQMSLGMLESALKSGEQVSFKDMRARVEALNTKVEQTSS